MTKVKITKLERYVPVEKIFNIFKDYKAAVFLDTSLKNSDNRFSIIAINSYCEIVLKDKLFVNGRIIEEDIFVFLRKYLKDDYEINHTGLPIISGAVGFFSYDFGKFIEKIPDTAKDDLNLPYCILNFYDNFIIENHETKEVFITANDKLKSCEDSINEIKSLIRKYSNEFKPETEEYNVSILSNFTKEKYLESIEKIKEYILNGDIYIVNLTQRLAAISKRQPYDAFLKLRNINPSPFGGYLNYLDFKIVCASPERFLKVKNGFVETRPIKGTRKRGGTKEQDQKLKNELLNSEKDKSELLMIVDLERNDLSKVSKKESVKVTELFELKEYATVFHLESTIVSELKADVEIIDLIKAAFPGGSITGAPKIRAMEIIDEIENVRRSIYTGSIGYISLDKSCDLNIVIRTMIYKDNKYYIGVGGGITYESDNNSEYEETLQKAKALLESLA
jgi:para-aminobenzoate synthetase component 1